LKVSRRYRLPRLPSFALALAIPLGLGMLIILADLVVRRDFGLLAAVALVIVLAWAGGIWPGLVATLVLVLLFAGPVGTQHFSPPLDDISLFLFVAAGLVGTGVVESQHRARWRVEVARDRSRIARRAEHAARAELESIVAAIGDGIVVSDAHGSVSLMNRAAIDILGSSPRRFAEVAEAFAIDKDGLTAGQLLAGEGPTSGEFALAADGRRIELSTFLFGSEGEERRILLLRDVTEARRRDRLRDAFLSLLSHELRTPMTAVYGGATLLQRIGDRLDPQTRHELRNDIVVEADRLSRLIDDLLVLTRLEGGGQVGHEPALLQHLVADVATQDDRDRRGVVNIDVSAEPGLPPVIGDETSIRQVTHNLISNAVKYSPPGSTVEVWVEPVGGGEAPAETEADGAEPFEVVLPAEVAVRVLDRGPGVAGSEAEVFDLFFRGSTTQGVAPGLGIGLFVCRRLVEAMGGRIWTRARDGGGSEFGFALRVWPIEEEEADQPEAPAAEPRRELVVARPAEGPRW
jgi:K+-sensing histidine kinase KdpD